MSGDQKKFLSHLEILNLADFLVNPYSRYGSVLSNLTDPIYLDSIIRRHGPLDIF